MITYKCEFCGGELVISPSGDLRCDYCGSKSHFSDAQLREYREFRSNMLKYLAAAAERKSGEKDDSGLWSYAEREYFQTEDGQDVTVEPWILDYEGDLYGREIALEFYAFLRPERKFPDLQALKAEIVRNAQQTRDYFREKPVQTTFKF